MRSTIETISIAAALGGGFISFVSPCVLPVVPGILTVVTGTNITSARPDWRPVLRDTLLFIFGFSVVFIALGAGATSIGAVIFRNQGVLARVTGAIILIMGIYLLGSIFAKSPWLYREKRFHPPLERFGPWAAPVTGVAFGFGWTPCIGPVLTAILGLAAIQDSATDGAILLGFYAVGLGVPFVITALAYTRLTPVFSWFKAHMRGATILTGGTMSVFGILLVTGQLAWITTQLQNFLRTIGLEELIFLG